MTFEGFCTIIIIQIEYIFIVINSCEKNVIGTNKKEILKSQNQFISNKRTNSIKCIRLKFTFNEDFFKTSCIIIRVPTGEMFVCMKYEKLVFWVQVFSINLNLKIQSIFFIFQPIKHFEHPVRGQNTLLNNIC